MRVVIVILTISACYASAQTIDECLQKDSISCVQKSLFSKAKEFFDRESFEIITGINLAKKNNPEDVRGARSSEALIYEQEIDKAQSVAERQRALENYVGEEVSNFFYGRSLKINFGPLAEKMKESARALSASIPEELKQATTDIIEGRGKKKLLKNLLPLLLLVKLKIGALLALTYAAVGFVAKTAIVNSLLALAISSYIGMRSYFTKGAHESAYSGWSSGQALSSGGWAAPSVVSSGGGWSSGAAGATGWDDAHGAYSAQNQAYSGYGHH